MAMLCIANTGGSVKKHYFCVTPNYGVINLATDRKTKSVFIFFNPIQDGGEGAKRPIPTSFSPVTSTNVGIRHQNFLTFTFNTFATVV